MSVLPSPSQHPELLGLGVGLSKRPTAPNKQAVLGQFDFLHPKAASLSDKPSVSAGPVSGKLRIVKPVSTQPARSLGGRRRPSTCSPAAPSSTSTSLSTSLVDSLSLTSTSTFPAAYTAAAPSSPKHSRRSVSSSALLSPSRSATAAGAAASVAASPSHQRAHTAEELTSNPPASLAATPRQDTASTPPHSPSSPRSPSSAERTTQAALPPTVRKAERMDEEAEASRTAVPSQLNHSAQLQEEQQEAATDDDEEAEATFLSTRRLEDGEEESEELTNTTLADASLPESEDGGERRRRRQDGEGSGSGNSGGAGGGGNGGGDRTVNESANSSTASGIDDILHFMRQSIVALSPPSSTPTSSSCSSAPLTLEQLSSLSPSALLAQYKAALSPVMTAHSELMALRASVKEAELEGLKECKRQVEKAKVEVEAKYSEELRRVKEKRDKKANKDRSRRLDDKLNVTAASSRHNSTLTNVSYINQSLSFHDLSIDPTLSLTTDLLEPRTVTFTLSTLDTTTHSPQSNVTLALFSSRLANHALWSFVGQTESRLPIAALAGSAGSTLAFDRRLVMRDVRTWHARDKLRVSAYWVAVQKAGGEERKEMMGQVECDTYKLFTAFGSQPHSSLSWEALKAQETADAIQGYSVRQLCVPLLDERGMQCGSTRLLLQAHITPPLACDSYPPSPERVKRAGRGGLQMDTSINLSLIQDSHHHFNHSLAAPSFIDSEPLSPILPTKHTSSSSSSHQSSKPIDRTQRESTAAVQSAAINTTIRASQCAGTQCDATQATECGVQTDTPVEVRRVYRDAATNTDEPPAPPAKLPPTLTVCTQEPLTIEPVLRIAMKLDAGLTGHSSCDSSCQVVFHQEASGCSSTAPTSPQHASSACSSANSSPTSASNALQAAAQQAAAPAAASPLHATLMALSTALSVPSPLPLPQAKLSTASQHSLNRIVGLLRRQYSASLQWFLDTTTTAPPASATAATSKPTNKGAISAVAVNGAKPTWNPSINPAAPSRLLHSIRLHSHWQPDSSCTSCSHCQSSFSLLKRKHHCRLCGSTACDECSKKSVELQELGLPGLQRVCDVCEMVWSAGKGLKTVGMPVIGTEAAPASDEEAHAQATTQPKQQQPLKALPPAGRSRKGAVVDSQPSQPAQPAQPTQPQPHRDEDVSTPTLARASARVRPTPAKRLAAGDKEAAATPGGTVRRVTRSAAKENANTINLPAPIPEATPKRTIKAKSAAAQPAGTARVGGGVPRS